MPLLPRLVSYVRIKLGARFTKAVLSKSIVLSEQEHYSINAIFEYVVSDECNAFLVLCEVSYIFFFQKYLFFGGLFVLSDIRPFTDLTFYNVLARQDSSFCNFPSFYIA